MTSLAPRCGLKPAALVHAVLLTVVATGVFGADKVRELKPDKSVTRIPLEQDIKIGQQALRDVPKQLPVVQNGQIQGMLDRIVKNLTSQPEAGSFPYTVNIIADQSINASAYPGGAMFVHTGLIASSDNEDQVAGVMAHEVSHVALRHGVANMVRAQKLQTGAAIGGVLAGIFLGNGMGGQLAQMGIGLTAQGLFLKNSREAETEADLLGTRLMNKAGYNPIEMARFFEKLEAEGGGRGLEFFNSHPNPGNRVRNVETEIQLLPRGTYNSARPREFSQAKTAVQGIKAPSRPAAGPAASSPGAGTVGQGSGGLNRYRAASYAIDFPAQWQVSGDRQNPDAVIIAPRNGVDRQGNISVGLLVSQAQLAGGLERSTQTVIETMARQNRGLRIGGERRITVGSAQGLLTTLATQSPSGEGETDYLLSIALRDRLLYMVFVTPDRSRPQAEPIYQRMIESIELAR
jgi:hypothetical protein